MGLTPPPPPKKKFCFKEGCGFHCIFTYTNDGLCRLGYVIIQRLKSASQDKTIDPTWLELPVVARNTRNVTVKI